MNAPIINQKEYDVYVITCNVNGKQYVGITSVGAEQRWKGHIYGSYTDTHFGRAIRKHGAENFTVKVLEKVIGEDAACAAEEKWIRELGTYGNGYNSTTGGHLNAGCPISDEHKQRLRELKTGVKLSQEHRDSLSRAKLAYFSDVENTFHLSRYWAELIDEKVLAIFEMAETYEFTHNQIAESFGVSPTTVSNIHNGIIYKHVERPERRYKGDPSTARRLRGIEEIAKLYEDGCSIGEIATKWEYDPTTVCRKLKEFYGDRWHSSEQKERRKNERKAERPIRGKVVYKIDPNTGDLLETFASVKLALASVTNNKSSSISQCANGEIKTAYGYKWAYSLD